MTDSVEQAKKDFYDGHEPEAAEALKKALEAEQGSVVPNDEHDKAVEARKDDEDEVEDEGTADADAPVVSSGNLNTNVTYETPGG